MTYDNPASKKLDKRKLKKLIRLCEEAGALADELDLQLFGHSGSGYILKSSIEDIYYVADINNGVWDGGDPNVDWDTGRHYRG